MHGTHQEKPLTQSTGESEETAHWLTFKGQGTEIRQEKGEVPGAGGREEQGRANTLQAEATILAKLEAKECWCIVGSTKFETCLG